MRAHLSFRVVVAAAATVAAAVLAGSATAAPAGNPPGANLVPVKGYLLQHTKLLARFTGEFEAVAARYDSLARGSGYDYAKLWRTQRATVAKTLTRARSLWVEGNPYYERVEGIVAGTPSLSKYDVIIDAGASAKEDPASAVPFDVRLADGRVLKQPGNFYNLTEGMLWGSRTEFVKSRVDLDGDGKAEFGEVLPDAIALKGAADGFARYARELDRASHAWKPTASDAFTSVVVMVPTMTEYFGQWKVSRFIRGAKADGDAFNVVSRLSDIKDILGGLEVIYAGIRPAVAKQDVAQGALTAKELASLRAFILRLYAQERSGKRFTPEQADTLGRQAQERGTAIAGQVSQSAARLQVKIAQ